MRSNVLEYALTAPPTLTAVLQALASDPTLTPIAGGTELMVALSAGRLPQKNLLSINHLRELRFHHHHSHRHHHRLRHHLHRHPLLGCPGL